jgi:hypothetical protein
MASENCRNELKAKMKKLPKFNDYVSDTLPVLCSSGPVTSFYR